MKTTIAGLLTLSLLVFSCEKVKNPIPKSGSSEINWSLYPEGDSAHYVANYWPEFDNNTNTERNVLIENFTGHRCFFCVPVDEAIHEMLDNNPNRVFEAAIHSGPQGLTLFQETSVIEGFLEEYFNDDALTIGTFFGNNSPNFQALPRVSVSRKMYNNEITYSPNAMSGLTTEALDDELQVNIQIQHNYFAATRGLFTHVEVDKLDQNLTDDLSLIMYVVEDSMISPQSGPNGIIPNYVHKNIFRGSVIDPLGHVLEQADLEANGKYYYFSSYQLPLDLAPENLHLLVFVRNTATQEILQVIKHDL